VPERAPPTSNLRARIARVDNFPRNGVSLSPFFCPSPVFRGVNPLRAFFPFSVPRFVRGGINRERDNVVAPASCMTNDTDMACLHEPSRRYNGRMYLFYVFHGLSAN